ncbi:hypothetical protein [Paenibacillus pseudetheri]|uniref:Uncharacterized protein n=1 Tax=Paenibacillus pseudetheri TaxID=2897682 RepID=A0ABM9BG77_9BACL|nr:hypothetical protein [Paenibacillus pseudetheri]CAH1057481.1 hypothetical protein PAECIP111894_03639 [Paenibacillus pseudetheri]
MKALMGTKTSQFIILIILIIACFIYGIEVFDQFDGKLFSHAAVPLGSSLIFLFLLIGVGIMLGFLIEGTSMFSTIILMWPLIHIGIVIFSFFAGHLLWELLFVIALYSFIDLPINLIGEGISLGFQINRLLFRRDQNKLSEFFIAILINLVIIIIIIIAISKHQHADLFM